MNGTIFYRQGIFLFNLIDNEFWNTSLFLEFESAKEKIDINYLLLERSELEVRVSIKSSTIDDF